MVKENNYIIKNTHVLMNIVSQQLLHIKQSEESPIKIYLFERSLLAKEESQWVFLTDCKKKQTEEDLRKYLSSEQKKDESKCSEKYIIYSNISETITDSRYNRITDKEVKTAWIFVADEKRYAYEIISQVFIRALMDRLTDLLQLENVINLIVKKNETDADWLSKEGSSKFLGNNIISRFCSKLLDKDWLVNKYVDFALVGKGLPESEKFLQLSAMRYETRESMTRLYFGNKEVSDLEMKFDKEMISKDVLDFKPGNYRTIRKLMELAGNGYGLMIDITDIEVKKVCGVLNTEKQKIPECYVEIDGYLSWSLNVGNEKVFQYSNGMYNLQKVKAEIETEKKFDDLRNYLLEKEWANKDNIDNIINCLKMIKKNAVHGASVVFLESEVLQGKVKELSKHNKAYYIEEINLLNAIKISGLTSIDGAIMADLKCDCMGIGAILDGKSLIAGNAGRGARYNSVANYVRVIAEENIEHKCFAAIFSEDKTVDFVCIDKNKSEEKIKLI